MHDGLKKNLRTLMWLLHELSDDSIRYRVLVLLHVILAGIYPVIIVYLPKVIVDSIIEVKPFKWILGYIIILALATFVYTNAISLFDASLQKIEYATTYRMKEKLGELVMHINFSYLENSKMLDEYENAYRSLLFWSNGISLTSQTCMKFASNIISLMGILTILISNRQIFSICLPIFVLLFIMLEKKKSSYDVPFFSQMVKYNREFNYYTKIMKEVSFGKEIRLYDAKQLITDHTDRYQEYSDHIFRERAGLRSKNVFFNDLIQGIYYTVMFMYLALKTITGAISIGNFVLYSNAYTNFVNISLELFGNYTEINRSFHFFGIYFDFYEKYKNVLEKEKQSTIIRLEANLNEIIFEFSNVWFRYDETQEYILKDINIKISSKETLSIVGRNGAGKTTFIKLLIRLYEPSKGVIKLNGIDIKKIPKSAYYRMISTVFQDFQIYAASVKENVVMSKPYIENELRSALKDVNLKDFVEELNDKEATNVSKLFDNEGIDLSGGQKQRLAIARAIYQNTPIIILDEPTSALDPKMEYEIFQQVQNLSSSKGIIFISHRLSSCKFSDRILVFCDGRIIQEGTHEELVMQKKKLYYELFTAQAKYYV
ncbi:ABC transporter ATP-binding protein [Clostridium sp. E02]|uniref:ABC transporter ATP-binding protein n=1 Tax=Clostridium sp. E02 TaxID=2487134 RepID=UPI0013DE7700|nr:ABC transporter ATP-binding protein [Clostridium sp. E02]